MIVESRQPMALRPTVSGRLAVNWVPVNQKNHSIGTFYCVLVYLRVPLQFRSYHT